MSRKLTLEELKQREALKVETKQKNAEIRIGIERERSKLKQDNMRVFSETNQEKQTVVKQAHDYLMTHYPSGSVLYNTLDKIFVFDNKEYNFTKLYLELRLKMNIAFKDLELMMREQFSVHYNPIKQYFTSLPEKYKADDVRGAINTLCKSVSTTNDDLFVSMLTKHMIRSIKQVLDEDFINRFIFVLQQEEQNTGKSSFLKFLNPFKNKYYTETIEQDKQILALANNFMINMEELETFNKREVQGVKALISKGNESIRTLYTQQFEPLNRLASFWGSTNDTNFLEDNQNTRWLITQVTAIRFDYNNHNTGKGLDINKVWADAMYLYLDGEYNSNPSPEEWEQLTAINKGHTYLNDTDHYIKRYLRFLEIDDPYYKATPTQVCDFLINKGYTRATPTKIGRSLSKLGAKKMIIENVRYWILKTDTGKAIDEVMFENTH